VARRKPYTTIGIRRIPCTVPGCGKPSRFQWRTCADGVWRPVCADHDIRLNRLVVRSLFGCTKQAERMLERYAEEVVSAVLKD
jgi:hypothetical protein